MYVFLNGSSCTSAMTIIVFVVHDVTLKSKSQVSLVPRLQVCVQCSCVLNTAKKHYIESLTSVPKDKKKLLLSK